MRKALCLAVLCAACGSFVCARAAGPTLQWELRDINHPRMGSIKVAVPKSAITTAVQKERIVSLVYLSCEKASGKIAIELANASAADATTTATAPAPPSAQAAAWKPARTIRKGRTNVRAAPGLDSRVVGELAPG